MDHCRREKRKTNPRETTNIFSLLTFAYIGSLFKKAIKNDLKEDDIYEVLKRHRSKNCGDKLEREWMKQRKEKGSSVGRLLWKCYGKRYLLIGLIDFVFQTTNSIVRPYVVSHFVMYFTRGQTTVTKYDAYFYGASMLSLQFFTLFYNHNYMIWVQMFGMEIRTAFSSLLYRKALKLSSTAVADTNLGNIVNLITRDVQSFVSVIFSINDTWVSMTQVMVICYLLFNKVGVVSFVGIGILLSAFPLQGYIASWVTRFRLETCKKTDERLQVCQEILSSMRIIKMYTWETFFTKKVTAARKAEMKKLLMGTYSAAVLIITAITFSSFGFYMLILACMWTGVSTDTGIIFYILASFRDLRHFLGVIVPAAMASTSSFVSSYKRLSKALEAEELIEEYRDSDTEKPLIELKDVTVQIKEEDILKNLSFKLTKGLTVITGPVGSGKSTMLKAILKDIPLRSGSVSTEGRISYASQDPWLFPSSIKQNILFGELFRPKRYQRVIKSCALTFDFNLLEKGDETIVTDRGLNLSRGQQARINLARAIYRNSDIYLLDDSLTALDTSVQEYIFDNCIKTFLKDKICVLISQSANHIKQADTVIVMDGGRIEDIGPPKKHILMKAKELIKENDDLEKEVVEIQNPDPLQEVTEKTNLIQQDEPNKSKVYSEVKREGSVEWRVYKQYVVYGGGFFLILFNIFMRGSTQVALSSSDRLLTKWVDDQQTVLSLKNHINNSSFNSSLLEAAKLQEAETFKRYSLFLVLTAVLELITTYLLMDFFRRASVNLHKNMITRVINSVMSFFDTHLIGNILNRLSQDMLNVDENLSMTIGQCIRAMFNVGGQFFILILINPSFAIIIGVVLICTLILSRIYLPAGRSLKRLEASTRSPMVGHLNATLEGLTTVRASNVQDILIEEYDRHQDLYTSANFLSTCSQRAFGFFVDAVCSGFAVFIVIKFLFFNDGNTAGDIGLSITQVMLLSIILTWCIRQFTELENYMTSLERVMEYTDIKTEPKDGAVIKDWPSFGGISYQKVSLSYGHNETFVLNNLNFDIKPKEKIGIVGRTGAGKSSIISTIFRLYDVEGKILIDGVDIKQLSLNHLRQNIVVIPQDPIIFSGTIRSNLDPLNQFEDKALWETLEKVGMKNVITGLEQEINSAVLKFSSGQKQLLCLARAILRKNKIVVMDEATANMDHVTDQLLHKVIKENFSDCTVLTVAHRLHSVLECDRVMVMDRGEIKEFDEPSNLLRNENGMFYAMVKQAELLNYLNS